MTHQRDLGDMHRQIPHAFEVPGDTHRAQHEPQVRGDGLVSGQQQRNHLLDVGAPGVEQGVAAAPRLGVRGVEGSPAGARWPPRRQVITARMRLSRSSCSPSVSAQAAPLLIPAVRGELADHPWTRREVVANGTDRFDPLARGVVYFRLVALPGRPCSVAASHFVDAS